MILAIDTSTQLAGLALFDGQVRAELTWVAGRHHSTQLLPEIERLLALVGASVDSVQAVAAARGPGSFTGVRVGLAVAQGLALALQRPAYGVCSLDILAAAQESSPLPVRPLLDAGRGRFATALYEWRDGRRERTSELISVTREELADLISGPCLLCGDISEELGAWVRQRWGEQVQITSPALSLRRPGVLAQIGWQQLREGQVGDPAALQPVYLAR